MCYMQNVSWLLTSCSMYIGLLPPAEIVSRKLNENKMMYSPLYCIYCVCPFPASLHPSLVNVHIQHPPEAEVRIHQVARVQPGQRPATPEGAHSVQQRSQPGNVHELPTGHSSRHPHTNGNGHIPVRPHFHQNGHVGRCFQETVDGQVMC